MSLEELLQPSKCYMWAEHKDRDNKDITVEFHAIPPSRCLWKFSMPPSGRKNHFATTFSNVGEQKNTSPEYQLDRYSRVLVGDTARNESLSNLPISISALTFRNGSVLDDDHIASQLNYTLLWVRMYKQFLQDYWCQQGCLLFYFLSVYVLFCARLKLLESIQWKNTCVPGHRASVI